MPMIWTAGNLVFLVFVGAAVAFLMGSEMLEARRSRARRVLTVRAEPARREPWRRSHLPPAALRRTGLD